MEDDDGDHLPDGAFVQQFSFVDACLSFKKDMEKRAAIEEIVVELAEREAMAQAQGQVTFRMLARAEEQHRSSWAEGGRRSLGAGGERQLGSSGVGAAEAAELLGLPPIAREILFGREEILQAKTRALAATTARPPALDAEMKAKLAEEQMTAAEIQAAVTAFADPPAVAKPYGYVPPSISDVKRLANLGTLSEDLEHDLKDMVDHYEENFETELAKFSAAEPGPAAAGGAGMMGILLRCFSPEKFFFKVRNQKVSGSMPGVQGFV